MEHDHFTHHSKLESDLWEAADNLRANSKLTSTEYCMPVLGVIFLRHAFNRFDAVTGEIKASGLKRKPIKADYIKRRSLYLPEAARYDYLLDLPSETDLGEALITAMDRIEESFQPLQGVLPKEYTIFERAVLEDLLRTFDRESLRKASGDVFGRIYEYFLMKFAMQGAQDNGEFFTPPSLVQTIVNVIEPTRGIVLDPAVGSAGMFVQSSHFVERMGKDAAHNLTFYGQEKTATTIRLAKMNLAVHGLEGDIVEANTFYEDQHSLVGKCDYVMANPPFNVDMVDAEKVKGDIRLPFGLPGVNKKKKVSNGNYLWIQYFYSYLNKNGRSGFVMASSASDAGGGDDKSIRQKLVESGHVDVMIAIGTNFFYTRTLPCMLWFLDKGKPKKRSNRVLMIDARGIHRKVTRVINDFSPEQLQNISSIVWLHRGEIDRYLALVREYLTTANAAAVTLKQPLAQFAESMAVLLRHLRKFGKSLPPGTDDAVAGESYQASLTELATAWKSFQAERKATVVATDKHAKWIGSAKLDTNKQQQKAHERFEPVSDRIRSLRRLVETCIKAASRCHDVATKELAATKSAAWKTADIRNLHKDLIRTPKDDEEQNLRVVLAHAFKQPPYFHRQAHWLQAKFPDAQFADIEGLCRSVDRAAIEDNDWSLTPGRYVGVAPVTLSEDVDFQSRLSKLHQELAELDEDSRCLAREIDSTFRELML